ncbi:Lsr2 family protein [Micromonospora sp. C31]|uniref:Lsr2 family DNA-binding protein n=1 Tax=Micromonospora sp. C31 TaxID=2824876 RepID=UPI001B35E00E|nr:histone-like nucleoid-structuring protein Lsr2 [Micromonospora sp. C31]MBQ1076418.1 Lsr2 family protein [Micromonospora sp. C31]
MSAPTITPTNGTDQAALLRAAQGTRTVPAQQLPMGIRVMTGPSAAPVSADRAEQAPACRPPRTLEQLLTLAKGSEAARTRQLAEKIGGLVEELTGRLEAEQAAEMRRRELAEKEAKLTAELAELRQKMGTGAEAAAQRAAIRQWAKANGYTVRERGRIPRNVVQAWAAATGSEVAR